MKSPRSYYTAEQMSIFRTLPQQDSFFEKFLVIQKESVFFFMTFLSFKNCFDFYVPNSPKSLMRQYCISVAATSAMEKTLLIALTLWLV